MKLRVLVAVLIAGLVGCAGLAQDVASPRPPAQSTIAGAAGNQGEYWGEIAQSYFDTNRVNNDTIRKMFAYRHDILKAMIADGVKLVVLGKNETLNDLPESRHPPYTANATMMDYTLARKLLVVTEQSVLAPSGPSEEIALFATAAYRLTGLRPVDPNFDRQQKQQYELRVQRMDERFDQKLQKALDAARAKNLWGSISDKAQYWARGVQAYFDAGAAPATTREELKAYDPNLSTLVEETMAYTDHQDWRFKHYADAR